MHSNHHTYRIRLLVLAGIICGHGATPKAIAQQATAPAAQISASVQKLPLVSRKSDNSFAVETGPTTPDSTNSPKPASSPTEVRQVYTTIEVNAREQTLRNGLAVPYHITRAEVLSSAGTWEDFTRYLQVLPGVVWNTDMSNDVMVRGGHPSENLYVIDGIEAPNINHLAVEGTTGGFTSMLDSASISSVDMKAGVYDARYSSRLSSLIEIRTRENQGTARTGEINVGIGGVGGFLQRPFGTKGSLLLAAHRSVLNLLTNDIGLNGVPIYTNGLARFEWLPSGKNHVSALSLNGADSIYITPTPCDDGLVLPFQTSYRGIRSTDGLVWQHFHNTTTVSTLTASYSAQNQTIGQQALYSDITHQSTCQSELNPTTVVYGEHTRDGSSNVGYSLQFDRRNWYSSFGTTGRLVRMDYAVTQPLGQQSPFNPNPNWTDADNFTRSFLTGQSGTYAETTGRVGTRWTVIAGAREETFALTGAHVFEPRASVAFRISEHQVVNGAYGRSSQLAPSINILSYAQNARLRPLQVEQFMVGADLWRAGWGTVSMETYHKRYSNEPVSTEYPSLMLANMVDTLGQQFVWLPLKSGGHGHAEGVELLVRARVAGRFQMLGSASYARTLYAAADGVLRAGNFDFPLVLNCLASTRLPWAFQISARDSYATGRPYTPFNLLASEQQYRGVYDLDRINALRGPAYNRLDIDLIRDFRIHKGILRIHAGVENALNRQNFLGLAWMGNCHAPSASVCGLTPIATPGIPDTVVTQMPIFPNVGVKYSF